MCRVTEDTRFVFPFFLFSNHLFEHSKRKKDKKTLYTRREKKDQRLL